MSWTAFTDGGSRGNPGPAGAGVCITDDGRTAVFEGGFFLGRMTNNQAEYRGLLAALDLLQRAGAKAVDLFTDSELMVQQITGGYRVRSPGLKPLCERAQERLRAFQEWRVQHVPRERNTRADRLANQAMDAGANVVVTDRLGLLRERQAGHPQVRTTPRQHGPPAVEVLVRRAPERRQCPSDLRRGRSFVFTDVTPAGLCVDACAAVMDAVLALRELELAEDRRGDEAVMTPRCRRSGCGAVFEVRLLQKR